MTTDTLRDLHGVPVLDCADDGPALRDDADALDVIGDALGRGAELVVLPAGRLDDAFFQLRSGVAGEIVQKFVNYRLRLAVVGDISAHLAASSALRDFVTESNRGRQLWFLPSRADLEERLGPAGPR
ncbi:DUF4180 domain-containing protein [Micromonospora sp. WMMD812]|uniref:DUF4180 domain-containing protein n=1 Tax=Micromonospora sp. WMMD812 TaxID=3015152 RepID=UPI00248AE1F6|nr:DUF4180 domain-containing protein [Micromonospora sp. WMMD812]WBB70499.1 DUF4180 domain-containing protein [Micromonospora sp. WMMD812]